MELSQRSGLAEDASLERGVGSILNHKPKRQANVEFIRGRNNRVKLLATKPIRNHSELTASYGRNYRFNEDVRTSTNNSKYLA